MTDTPNAQARLAELERLADSLVGCGNAVFNTGWSDGVEMLLHLANAHRNALADAVVPKAVHLAELTARLAEATALAERTKLEAQIHAQEARAQRATVHECYRAVTRGTGEPADWNGSRPVVECITKLRARLATVEAQRDTAVGMLAEWCVAVDVNGSGWDDWDEHYKDAMYRPNPLRAELDAAIATERKRRADEDASLAAYRGSIAAERGKGEG